MYKNYINDELYHHGILGQKWGIRRFQNEDGTLTKAGKTRYGDRTISSNAVLTTLSHDPNRTKNTDMFFAAYTTADKNKYRALFNRPMKKAVFDENGFIVGEAKIRKYRIDNKLKKNVRVAGEDTGIETFKKLYKNDESFRKYVNDPKQMESLIPNSRYSFKGYNEARKSLNSIRTKKASDEDLSKVYRLYNYSIPNNDKNTVSQRTKFFKELSKSGYGALFDTNDGHYGGFHAQSPVIVFDTKKVIPEAVYASGLNGKLTDKRVEKAKRRLSIFGL